MDDGAKDQHPHIVDLGKCCRRHAWSSPPRVVKYRPCLIDIAIGRYFCYCHRYHWPQDELMQVQACTVLLELVGCPQFDPIVPPH